MRGDRAGGLFSGQTCVFFNDAFEESERASQFWVSVKAAVASTYNGYSALSVEEAHREFDLRQAVQKSSVFVRLLQVGGQRHALRAGIPLPIGDRPAVKSATHTRASMNGVLCLCHGVLGGGPGV